jgi:hypothetical protein
LSFGWLIPSVRWFVRWRHGRVENKIFHNQEKSARSKSRKYPRRPKNHQRLLCQNRSLTKLGPPLPENRIRTLNSRLTRQPRQDQAVGKKT